MAEIHPPGRRPAEGARFELPGHPRFPSGRFTNWVRFLKVDLECEGVIERVGRSSPQRVRMVPT